MNTQRLHWAIVKNYLDGLLDEPIFERCQDPLYLYAFLLLSGLSTVFRMNSANASANPVMLVVSLHTDDLDVHNLDHEIDEHGEHQTYEYRFRLIHPIAVGD